MSDVQTQGEKNFLYCQWWGEGAGQCVLGNGHSGSHRYEHQWVAPKPPIQYRHCRLCGIIQRLDGMNGHCRGPVRVGPREEKAT